jgi:hypothetical protein
LDPYRARFQQTLKGREINIMMTIEEAVLKASQIYVAGWQALQRQFQKHPEAAHAALEDADRELRVRAHVEELSTHRSGNVTVRRVLARAIGACPYCDAVQNAGHFLVRHQDGQEVRFDVMLVHYAQAGHLISSEDVNIDTLISVMENA